MKLGAQAKDVGIGYANSVAEDRNDSTLLSSRVIQLDTLQKCVSMGYDCLLLSVFMGHFSLQF